MHNPKENMMAIIRTEPRFVATVEIEDDYAVVLRQRRKGVVYTPREAQDLGKELIEASMASLRMQKEDEARRASSVIRDESGTVVL